MRHMTHNIALVLAFALASCGQSASSTQQAQQTADALTGDAAGDAADNPLCKMFTPAEIASYGGASVKVQGNAAMGTGCQWVSASGEGDSSVMLQIADARYHEPPKLAPGFKQLDDAGTDGFVVPQMGGWHAGAIQGDKSINVSTGHNSSEAQTVAFLKEALKRAGGG